MIIVMRSVHTLLLLVLVRWTYQNSSVHRRLTVGGEEAAVLNLTTFPSQKPVLVIWRWAVSLSINGTRLCGGSILSRLWIITTTHCLADLDEVEVIVYAGSNIRWSGAQVRTVSEVILRPDYDYNTGVNDIALLKLSDPLDMSDLSIASICMPLVSLTTMVPNEWPLFNTTVVAIGWGKLKEDGLYPEKLQEVTLQTVDYRTPTCNISLDRSQVQLCAGVSDGSKDTCQGDSGGPLMMSTSTKQWVLVGLTSNGHGCARKGYSGVYTRVAAYKDWIKSYINDSCWIGVD